jgi:hypothetical protein
LAGETKVLGGSLPPHHFVHHKSHLPDLGANPGRRGGKSATNRFSYGEADCFMTLIMFINSKSYNVQSGNLLSLIKKMIFNFEKNELLSYDF